MQNQLNIRSLYNPLQPAIRQSGDAAVYREVLPHEKLQGIIYCYWQLKTTEKLSAPFVYRVVADGCIDIFFELNNPTENFVMGFCKTYTEFQLDNEFHFIGVRFLPTFFPRLFDLNVSEISNRYERLELITRQTSDYISNSFSIKDDLQSVAGKLNTHFLQLAGNTSLAIDPRFEDALNLILLSTKPLSIQSDLNTGLSARQLRRYFDFYIGESAKTFSQVLRFQKILAAEASTQRPAKNRLFFDLGYYDQAHFIKEFKNFYGTTPGKILS